MIILRRSEERRHVRSRIHDTRMTFDSSRSSDPFRRGFHALESLNEDLLSADRSLFPNFRSGVDVVTYVQDGTWSRSVAGHLEAGEFERASDLRGCHPTASGASAGTARVFQGCITATAVAPGSALERRRFPRADREGILRLVVSPDGRESSLRVRQDVSLYSSILLRGHHLIHELTNDRGAWLQVVTGSVRLREHLLAAGDGAALEGEAAVALTACEASEILLFDLA
jgi:quercetin 2,3-dioxygenase